MRPILVTGGAQGFGAEICLQLAEQGHDVVVHFRKSDPSNILSRCQKYGVIVDAIQGDFSTVDLLEDFIRRYLARFPKTKGLVNNVGNYLIAPPSQTESKEWLSLFQTNLFTPVFLVRALLPALKEEKGRVVNIGTCGLTTPRALLHATAYAATKSALHFYTRSLAKELAPDHINVNMVSPGYLETSVDLEEAAELPMGRPATLKEAARAVLFFFDSQSSYITGQNLEVAGGFGL